MNSEDTKKLCSIQGFTLLELLIALSLMAVIITLTFSAFFMGSRAWEKGEDLMLGQQILRTVPELMRRQLASFASPQFIKQDDHWIYLQGDNKNLVFFSNSSLYPASTSGIVYVQYLVKEVEGKEKLSFIERDINYLDVTELTEIDDASYLDLLSGYTSIAFEFLPAVDEENELVEWVSSWDPVEKKSLPKAVRLSFKKDSTDAPIVVIVPMGMKL